MIQALIPLHVLMAAQSITLPEVTQVIISVVTVGGSVGASLFTTYAWVKAKFAANDIEIIEIKRRIDEHMASGVRESSILANELMAMRTESSQENAEIKKIVTQVQINMASHDGVLKNLDRVIDVILNERKN